MTRFSSLGRLAIMLAVAGIALAACGKSNDTKAAAAAAPAQGATMTAGTVAYSGPDKILATDAANRTVTVNLVAGEGDAAKGFNFNGYANGDMHVQVPTGWTVKVSMIDNASTPHSALIVPWEERQAKTFHPAFTGSAPSDYASGIEKGDDAQTFSFRADKAGQYAVVCGVPGHDDLGMWDSFDVVDNLAAPQVMVKQ